MLLAFDKVLIVIVQFIYLLALIRIDANVFLVPAVVYACIVALLRPDRLISLQLVGDFLYLTVQNVVSQGGSLVFCSDGQPVPEVADHVLLRSEIAPFVVLLLHLEAHIGHVRRRVVKLWNVIVGNADEGWRLQPVGGVRPRATEPGPFLTDQVAPLRHGRSHVRVQAADAVMQARGRGVHRTSLITLQGIVELVVGSEVHRDPAALGHLPLGHGHRKVGGRNA